MPPLSLPAAVPTTILDALRKLAERWVGAHARERANYQLYLGELCAALDLEGPRPTGSGYEYEFPVKVIRRDGKETSLRDIWGKLLRFNGHFFKDAEGLPLTRDDLGVLLEAAKAAS